MDIIKGQLSKGAYFVFANKYAPVGWNSQYVSTTFENFVGTKEDGVFIFGQFPRDKYAIINVVMEDNSDLTYIPDIYPCDLIERNINIVGACIVERDTIQTNNAYCERKVANNILMPLYTLLTLR